MKPNGFPTATTNSPTRSAFESPGAAASNPEASTCKTARSRRRSLRTMWPGKRRPSQSSTCKESEPRASPTTCALVTILPSCDQITPDPLPLTCTVERRSFSTISPKAAPMLLSPAAGPLSDANIQILHHARSQKFEFDNLARRRPFQKFRQRFRLGKRLSIASQQNVSQDQSSNRSWSFRLDPQQHDS